MSAKTRNVKSSLISETHNHSLLLDSREIFLHSDINSDDDCGIDFRMGVTFLKNMKLLESFGSEPIIVHQDSGGGEWSCGMTIYDAVVQSPCSVVFVTHGICASMASITVQSVVSRNENRGYRVTMPNCSWLIHEGSDWMEGTNKQFFSYSEYSKKLKDKMYEIYTAVCEKSSYFGDKSKTKIKSFIKKKLDSKEDWWLTAEEAVSYGFCDGILGTPEWENLDKIKGYL